MLVYKSVSASVDFPYFRIIEPLNSSAWPKEVFQVLLNRALLLHLAEIHSYRKSSGQNSPNTKFGCIGIIS